jgi:hypothetical protein
MSEWGYKALIVPGACVESIVSSVCLQEQAFGRLCSTWCLSIAAAPHALHGAAVIEGTASCAAACFCRLLQYYY